MLSNTLSSIGKEECNMPDIGYIFQASIISSVILSMILLSCNTDQTGDRICWALGQIFRCRKIVQVGILLKSSSQIKVAGNLPTIYHSKADVKRTKNSVIANKKTPCQP